MLGRTLGWMGAGALSGGIWGALPGDGTMLGGAAGGAALGALGGAAGNRLLGVLAGANPLRSGKSIGSAGAAGGMVAGGMYGFFAGDETVTSGALKGGLLGGGLGFAAGRYGAPAMKYFNNPGRAAMDPAARAMGGLNVAMRRAKGDISRLGHKMKPYADEGQAIAADYVARSPKINATKDVAARAHANMSAAAAPTVNAVKDKAARAQAAATEQLFGATTKSNQPFVPVASTFKGRQHVMDNVNANRVVSSARRSAQYTGGGRLRPSQVPQIRKRAARQPAPPPPRQPLALPPIGGTTYWNRHITPPPSSSWTNRVQSTR